jgi:hypothetical protein
MCLFVFYYKQKRPWTIRAIEQKLSMQLRSKDHAKVLHSPDKYQENSYVYNEISSLILQYKQQVKQLEKNKKK